MMLKKAFLFIGLTVFLFSCKKDKADPTCDISVAAVAATYKLTKIESITGTVVLDVTGTFLDPCGASGLYKLNSDKSMTYTELATCAGDGTGTWDIVGGNISIIQTGAGIEVVSAPVSSFNCTNLVVTPAPVAGTGFRFTFTKQ